jgi:hypothetical protein
MDPRLTALNRVASREVSHKEARKMRLRMDDAPPPTGQLREQETRRPGHDGRGEVLSLRDVESSKILHRGSRP